MRSFEDVVASFRASLPPGAKLHEAELELRILPGKLKGYSLRPLPLEVGDGDFGAGAALHAKTIYLWPGTAEAQHQHVAWGPLAKLNDPVALVRTRLPALTTWKTRGPGFFAREPGAWVLAWSDKLFEQREDGPMLLAMAAWRVQDGLALAVWEKPDATLLRLVGLDALPAGEPFEMWIGP